MEHYIDKYVLVAELKKRIRDYWSDSENTIGIYPYALEEVIKYTDTLEVKEIDIDKLCEFRKNIGFSYPESASEYQKQLACYQQGIEDVLKAQKGEEV